MTDKVKDEVVGGVSAPPNVATPRVPMRAYLATTRVGSSPDAPIVALAFVTEAGRHLYLERNVTVSELLEQGCAQEDIDQSMATLLYRHRLVTTGGFEAFTEDKLNLHVVKGADVILAKFLTRIANLCLFPVQYDVHTLNEPYAWGDLQRMLALCEGPSPKCLYPQPMDIYPLYRFVLNAPPEDFSQALAKEEVTLPDLTLLPDNALYKALRARQVFYKVLNSAMRARDKATS